MAAVVLVVAGAVLLMVSLVLVMAALAAVVAVIFLRFSALVAPSLFTMELPRLVLATPASATMPAMQTTPLPTPSTFTAMEQ